jgi:hypothetical protein
MNSTLLIMSTENKQIDKKEVDDNENYCNSGCDFRVAWKIVIIIFIFNTICIWLGLN